MRSVYIFGLISFLTIACNEKADIVPENMKFEINGKHYKIPAQAVRTRKHKTISLKINSVADTKGIAITLLIDKYTDPFHYKNLPDSNIFETDKIQFVLIYGEYYEAGEGRLVVISDDDKTISGEFEFQGINPFDSVQIIRITNGSFEIDYSPSIAIETKY